jgi:recombinational DNA repair protein (RecF pathway)
MSYATYTTDALVCGAFDRNTADRSYLLFTREAGMLYAEAKSVREERSKQRYALQEFSQIRISLIKGKHTWKVGSVEATHNDYARAISREARGSVALVYKLLRRYIRGEEASPALYDYCVEALARLTGEVTERSLLELMVQVNILRRLGYVDEAAIPEILRTQDTLSLPDIVSPELFKTLTNLTERASLNSQL